MWDDVLEDSSVIQRFIKRGEERGVQHASATFRQSLILAGEKRFGAPSPSIRQAIETISDPGRLATLSNRLWEIDGWDELLK